MAQIRYTSSAESGILVSNVGKTPEQEGAHAVYRKQADGTAAQSSYFSDRVAATGKSLTYIFGVTGTIAAYPYAVKALSSLATYDLSGEIYPVGYTVHVSSVSSANPTEAELLENELAAVEPDDTGAWTLEGMAGFDGYLAAWFLVDQSVLDLVEASLSISLALTLTSGSEPVEAEEGLQYVILSLPEYGEMCEEYFPTITIEGERPDEVECAVYISKYADGDALTAEALTENLVSSADSASGSYTVTFGGAYKEKAEHYDGYTCYCVWCQSETGGLTAAYLSVVENVCLSGDTRIMLADGGVKRLDAVQPGDRVLAGDGTPTLVLRTARGLWNHEHTLYAFEDGTVIDEIHAHRFYNVEQGFWQLLGRWKLGEHARRQDGADVALVSRRVVAERKEMFGLWTASRDYWANGLLSGETAANQALLADATAAQAADMLASLDEQPLHRLMIWKEEVSHE